MKRRMWIGRVAFALAMGQLAGCPNDTTGQDADTDATAGDTDGTSAPVTMTTDPMPSTTMTVGDSTFTDDDTTLSTSPTGDTTTEDTGDTTDGGEDGGGEVIECPDHPLAPAPFGTCEVTMPGTAGTLLRGTVLTPGGILRAGQVLVLADGTIGCVDCDCSGEPGAAEATEITCGDGVISPGLINPHDHITYANNVPIGEGPDRYEHRHHWRIGSGGHVQLNYNSGASTNVVRAAELRFVMGGATSLASAGGRPGLARNLDVSGHLEGLALPVADSDTFPLNDASGIMNNSGCNYGANPTTHADIEDEHAYLPHISEGINLAARNEFVCTSMGNLDLIEPQTAVIHGIGLIAQDYALMQAEGSGLVWSPRSNVVLYGNTASVTAMHRMGVSISLGTDWVPSGSINLLRELACADALNRDYYDHYFSDRDLWKMVTVNAAFAVGAEQVLGRLVPGTIADIAVFRAEGTAQDHRAVVESNVDRVVLVMRAGEVLYGDDNVMSAPSVGAADCEPLDVCGIPKRVCMARDTGGTTTLVQAQSAIEAYYPLFFCGTPTDEPSCVPWRPTEYPNGITATDSDGDGIANADDNCPSVFNPVRWLEQAQADADGDDAGDVCDPCPLDATDACTPPDPDDFDDDGVENGADNCPFDANPGQADADGDGHGDPCDGCAVANPGLAACPLTIAAIRDPNHPDHPPEGSVVAITNVYVTGVRPDTGSTRGFYVQDDSLDPYTGLFVYTGSTSPGVQVGNRVAITGVYEEYFDTTQLTSPSITIQDAGVVLPFAPIVVAPVDIANGGMSAEPYEGMLVRVENVAITVQNPDAPMDFDEFTVTGGLRIDDYLTDSVTGSGLGNSCPTGTTFTQITGVHGFSFGNRKLFPRDPADVGWQLCDPFG